MILTVNRKMYEDVDIAFVPFHNVTGKSER